MAAWGPRAARARRNKETGNIRRTLDISVTVAVTFEHDDETGAYRLVGIVLDDSAAVFGDDYCAYVQEGPEAGD